MDEASLSRLKAYTIFFQLIHNLNAIGAHIDCRIKQRGTQAMTEKQCIAKQGERRYEFQ